MDARRRHVRLFHADALGVGLERSTGLSNSIELKAQSPTEEMRQRFEAWARSGLTGPRESSTLLARSRGGDYVLAATRAAWAAWQAAIQDLIELYQNRNEN